MKILHKLVLVVLLMFPCSCLPLGQLSKFHHQGSKINFPDRVNNFSRIWIKGFNQQNSDVGAQYLYKDGSKSLIVATIYVYPAPKLISIGSPQNVIDEARKKLTDNHFNLVKDQVVKKYPNFSLITDQESKANFRGKILYGRLAKYKIYDKFFDGEREQKLISTVELFAIDDWLIKFRVTYRDDGLKKEIEEKISEFKQEFLKDNNVILK